MPYKDPVKKAEYQKKYCLKNRERIRIRNKLYMEKNMEKMKEYMRIWAQENKDRYRVVCPICNTNTMHKAYNSCKQCGYKIMAEKRKGELNHMWAGDYVGEVSLHRWIRTHKPKPEVCELCHSESPREVANISGQYKRDINDFQWVCRRCHMKSDNRITNLVKYEKGHTVPLTKRNRNANTRIMGVNYNKSKNMWVARISVAGNNKEIGSSRDIYKAIELRKKAEIEYFGYTIIPDDITSILQNMKLKQVSEIEVGK